MNSSREHKHSDEMLKDLDNMLSRLNALEIVASDSFQKDTVKIMRMLVEGQKHTIMEFDHIKKAMDVTLQQIFKIQDQTRQ